MDSLPENAGAGPLAVLSRFRLGFHACLTARGDELFELADAVLCADGPVRALAGLSLAPEHRRGHKSRKRVQSWRPADLGEGYPRASLVCGEGTQCDHCTSRTDMPELCNSGGEGVGDCSYRESGREGMRVKRRKADRKGKMAEEGMCERWVRRSG